jgi:hypothetical protein
VGLIRVDGVRNTKAGNPVCAIGFCTRGGGAGGKGDGLCLVCRTVNDCDDVCVSLGQ